SEGGSIAQIRGNLVPYVRLRDLFGYGGKTSGVEQMAVVDVDGNRIGIVADEILGQYQTVIKPLSTAFRSIQEVSGSTILGDGSISLILDVTKIAQMTRVEKAIKNSKGASYAPNAHG
ncbi:MAG: chemotaxis protein CheW, partial [Spirochaetia bacterium]